LITAQLATNHAKDDSAIAREFRYQQTNTIANWHQLASELKLVGGLEHVLFFHKHVLFFHIFLHSVGNFIIPTDEHFSFFRGVGQPPTTNQATFIPHHLT
jgi:hypothetical protein